MRTRPNLERVYDIRPSQHCTQRLAFTLDVPHRATGSIAPPPHALHPSRLYPRHLQLCVLAPSGLGGLVALVARTAPACPPVHGGTAGRVAGVAESSVAPT